MSNRKQNFPFAGIERRQHPRIHVRQRLECRNQEDFRDLYISNLSRGGMFVSTPYPPQIGTLMQIAIRLPDSSGEIEVSARVVQVQAFGAGLQFLNLSRAQMQSIEAFINSYDTNQIGEIVAQGELVHVLRDPALLLDGIFSAKRTSLASLLRHIRQQRWDGVLRLFNTDGFRNLVFRQGWPIDMSSSRFNENYCLGRILRQVGSLSNDALQASLKEMVATGKRQGTVLLEKGLISWETLQKGLELQLALKLDELFHWQRGSYLFYRESQPAQQADWVEPQVDVQQVILRSVYRQAKQHESLLLAALCNHQEHYLVPTERQLQGSHQPRLFTSNQEMQTWQHLVHRQMTLPEVSATSEASATETNALVYGLICAGLLRLQREAQGSDESSFEQSCKSPNFFERLQVPWTCASQEELSEAHEWAVSQLDENSSASCAPKIEEAYSALANEFQRRTHRRQVVAPTEINSMAERLHRLGKLKLVQGDYPAARSLLQTAADLEPSRAEYDRWATRAKKGASR